MKKQTLAIYLSLSVTLGLGLAAIVAQSAAAQCFNAQQQPVSCPGGDKQKKPKPTTIPSVAPSGTPQGVTVMVTPNAAQLQVLCANLPAAGGATGSLPGGAAGSSPLGSAGSPAGLGSSPAASTNLAGSVLFESGGGGFVLGVLVALFVPGILRGIGGLGGDNAHGLTMTGRGGTPGPSDAHGLTMSGLGGGPDPANPGGEVVDNWIKDRNVTGEDKFGRGSLNKQTDVDCKMMKWNGETGESGSQAGASQFSKSTDTPGSMDEGGPRA